jgi:short-subunit dehydrogenase
MNASSPSIDAAERRPRCILVLGALSGIAQAYARLRAGEGAALALVARDEEKLTAFAKEVGRAGASHVTARAADLRDTTDAAGQLADIAAGIGGADEILIAYGLPGDQRSFEADPEGAAGLIATNFSSQAIWLLAAAKLLDGRDDARIVVLGSVAGDRGRRSNALYGATKAGLHVLAQGLAHRRGGGPRIVTLKLGPVATPQTANVARVQKLLISSETAAQRMARAIDAGRAVAYVPGWWRAAMLVIRSIPAPVFNRLDM